MSVYLYTLLLCYVIICVIISHANILLLLLLCTRPLFSGDILINLLVLTFQLNKCFLLLVVM